MQKAETCYQVTQSKGTGGFLVLNKKEKKYFNSKFNHFVLVAILE